MIRYYCLFFLLALLSCSKSKLIQNQSLYDFANYDQVIDKRRLLDSLSTDLEYLQNDSLKREILFKIAIRYEWLSEDKLFLKRLNQVYNLATIHKDTSDQAKVLLYKGDHYDSKQVIDSAYYYYLKSEKLYFSIKDSANLAKVLLYKAEILYNKGIYTECEIATIRAFQNLSKQDNTRLLYEANVQMALVLKELKEYDAALQYFLEIPGLLKKLKQEGYNEELLEKSWISYYNNLGGYYNETHNLQQGKFNLEKGLEKAETSKHLKLKAMLLNNYAYNQSLLNGTTSEVESLYNSSLKIRESIHHKQGIARSKLQLSKFKLKQKDTLSAIEIAKETYNLSLDNGYGNEFKESLKFLSINDIKNKDKYVSLYLKTQDSLNQIDKNTRNKFARIEFETSKIEKANALLSRNNTNLLVVIVLLIVSFIAVLLTYKLKLQNKRLLYEKKEQQSIQEIQKLLKEQETITNDVRDLERKKIANDLHDYIINKIFVTRITLKELVCPEIDKKEKLIKELQSIEKDVRSISHDIHNNLFDHKQLYHDILINLINSQKNDFNTQFTYTIDKYIDWNLFSIEQKTHLYLILQELLQNVNKHSEATNCYIFIIRYNQQIQLRVIDNGVGFELDKVKKGVGYKSIYTRLNYFNASLNVEIINDLSTVTIFFDLEN